MIDILSGVETKILNLVAALIILLVGYILGRFLSKLIQRILGELEINKILKEQAGVRVPIEEFLGGVVKYLIYFIAIVMALNQIGLTTTALQIILFIILIMIVVFIVLALKDFIPNVVAGFFIHQKRSLKPGNKISVNGIKGRIISVGLVETKIQTKKEEIVYIPNNLLTKHVVEISK